MPALETAPAVVASAELEQQLMNYPFATYSLASRLLGNLPNNLYFGAARLLNTFLVWGQKLPAKGVELIFI